MFHEMSCDHLDYECSLINLLKPNYFASFFKSNQRTTKFRLNYSVINNHLLELILIKLSFLPKISKDVTQKSDLEGESEFQDDEVDKHDLKSPKLSLFRYFCKLSTFHLYFY